MSRDNTGLARPKTPLRRAISKRLALMVATLLVVGGAVFAVAANGPAEPSAEAAAPVPGVRSDLTQWFKGRDKALVQVNDALVVVVQRKLARPGAGAPECRRLDAAIKALKARGPAPDPAVDALARAGEDKLALAATACLAGDLATTQRLVSEAMAERAAASLPLEETLEGE